ncbi:MAG: hypothetical protein HXS46_07195 [Theionarchaea archaeon]|nr:hypothetical protein [Theionarchaea archaeon]
MEVLTGMHAAFVDRARAQVAAVAETHLETGIARQLVFGECYLILEKKPEKSFEIFVDLVAHGVSRFIASREHPEKVKEHFASLQLHLCNYISATTSLQLHLCNYISATTSLQLHLCNYISVTTSL